MLPVESLDLSDSYISSDICTKTEPEKSLKFKNCYRKILQYTFFNNRPPSIMCKSVLFFQPWYMKADKRIFSEHLRIFLYTNIANDMLLQPQTKENYLLLGRISFFSFNTT